jgi:hypothetical protein
MLLTHPVYVKAEVDGTETGRALRVELIKKSLLREEPSSEGKVAGTLYHGAFDVLEAKSVHSSTWYKIDTARLGTVWTAASNTRIVTGKAEHAGPNTTKAQRSEVQKLEDLASDIEGTIAQLKKDSQKILIGIESVSKQKCGAEAKKAIVEISYESSSAKDQSMDALSGEINMLSDQVSKLIQGYKKKVETAKLLDDKLSKVIQNRKVLAEIQTMVGDVNGVNMDVAVAGAPDGMDLLNKRIDDALSLDGGKKRAQAEPVAKAAVVPESAPVVHAPPATTSRVSTVPQWVLDTVKVKGHEMNSANYGQVTVVKEGTVTIMVVKKEGEEKFKGIYGKLIKEAYESEGSFYFVLNMPGEQG